MDLLGGVCEEAHPQLPSARGSYHTETDELIREDPALPQTSTTVNYPEILPQGSFLYTHGSLSPSLSYRIYPGKTVLAATAQVSNHRSF